MSEPTGGPAVFDGGDLACGELLLRLLGWLRPVPAGSVTRIIATDFAAPIDIPAWCHLTGHRFLGSGVQPDGRPHFDVEVSATPRRTVAARPWHVVAED
jgi:tRNA 2-thiouridine synthesizing protein A